LSHDNGALRRGYPRGAPVLVLDNHRAVGFYHGKDVAMIASYLNRIVHFFFFGSFET
jgi:hypothetical protein